MPYARPALDVPRIVDAEGVPIPFGERWGMDAPPEDAYSVDAHPERFAPLHAIADALVVHLAATYEASVVDALDDARSWFAGGGPDVLRAVHLEPAARDAAPIAIAWSDYPGILVRAGAAHGGHYPVCGCEACDEPWERAADDLEQLVLAVAEGRLQESMDRGIGYAIEDATGAEVASGWGSATGPDVARRRAARARLAARAGDRWLPWPPRTVGSDSAV
ncbi:DUF6226 family protein [Agrococcus jejuensis]|uniref:Uncharacterized protein n=1 Tax=Agrococcus jejuensis TaxID=399736 RepID=A0A1G8GST7_9MICO|nr:DUF6226 family protein [Agrococcus jejuensis]SDH97331.1 hypothetical protein SAMN04489720_3052 [Agrococcus jejuensis]